jgi:hypothetical protein
MCVNGQAILGVFLYPCRYLVKYSQCGGQLDTLGLGDGAAGWRAPTHRFRKRCGCGACADTSFRETVRARCCADAPLDAPLEEIAGKAFGVSVYRWPCVVSRNGVSVYRCIGAPVRRFMKRCVGVSVRRAPFHECTPILQGVPLRNPSDFINSRFFSRGTPLEFIDFLSIYAFCQGVPIRNSSFFSRGTPWEFI